MLEIRYDKEKIEKLRRELRGFPANSLPKVMSRGLNSTATESRTHLAKTIAERRKFSASAVRKFLTVKRATYKNWRSSVNYIPGQFPLIRLNPRKTASGITYKHPFKDKRTLIKHAFRARMESGHRGVFIRSTEHIRVRRWVGMKRWWALKKYKTTEKEAINELRGPSTDSLFGPALGVVIVHIRAESMQRLAKNIHDQVRLILSRRLPA